MPFQFNEVVDAPELIESFTVLRDPGGKWHNGKYTPGATQTLTMYSPVSIESPKNLELKPEGDLPHGARVFWVDQPIYTTRNPDDAGKGEVSDIILYYGIHWRVLTVSQRQSNGYWRAVGVRMEGV